jgi:hypothetical protein
MEVFIGLLGGLAIMGLVGGAGLVVYRLLLRREYGNTPKHMGFMRDRKCPICGGRMEVLDGALPVIHCTTPKCPNYKTNI